MKPTYDELKRSLDLKPTLLDKGFGVDFGFSKYEQPEYLPGKTRDKRKLRLPAGPDLSHLNHPDIARLQRIGRAGGRRAKK